MSYRETDGGEVPWAQWVNAQGSENLSWGQEGWQRGCLLGKLMTEKHPSTVLRIVLNNYSIERSYPTPFCEIESGSCLFFLVLFIELQAHKVNTCS